MTAVARETVRGGTRLRASVPAPAVDDLDDILATFELSTAGDTRLRLERKAVVITRFVAGDDALRLRDAEAELGLVARAVATVVAGLLGASAHEDAVAALPPPAFAPPPAVVEQLAARYVTVSVPQSAWAALDPSTPPVATLQPGEWLDVLERTGDWARVRPENGGPPVYTDGRSLVPLP